MPHLYTRGRLSELCAEFRVEIEQITLHLWTLRSNTQAVREIYSFKHLIELFLCTQRNFGNILSQGLKYIRISTYTKFFTFSRQFKELVGNVCWFAQGKNQIILSTEWWSRNVENINILGTSYLKYIRSNLTLICC